jgi:hypothetical protein
VLLLGFIAGLATKIRRQSLSKRESEKCGNCLDSSFGKVEHLFIIYPTIPANSQKTTQWIKAREVGQANYDQHTTP